MTHLFALIYADTCIHNIVNSIHYLKSIAIEMKDHPILVPILLALLAPPIIGILKVWDEK